MSAYNTESALARLLRPHYSRGQDEGRALLREAFNLPGDLQINGDTLHVRLDPASAPRRSKALAALCLELTDTQTRYPGTNLTLSYSVKGVPSTHRSSSRSYEPGPRSNEANSVNDKPPISTLTQPEKA